MLITKIRNVLTVARAEGTLRMRPNIPVHSTAQPVPFGEIRLRHLKAVKRNIGDEPGSGFLFPFHIFLGKMRKPLKTIIGLAQQLHAPFLPRWRQLGHTKRTVAQHHRPHRDASTLESSNKRSIHFIFTHNKIMHGLVARKGDLIRYAIPRPIGVIGKQRINLNTGTVHDPWFHFSNLCYSV
nr:hypothetical protein [Paenibacillus polymyxa]